MSTTSQKHRNFVAEPMNEKPVTDLAGIGEVLGKRLQNKGFDKVSRITCYSFFKNHYNTTELLTFIVNSSYKYMLIFRHMLC